MLVRYHDAKCEFQISNLTRLLRVSENRKRVYMKSILACEQTSPRVASEASRERTRPTPRNRVSYRVRLSRDLSRPPQT